MYSYFYDTDFLVRFCVSFLALLRCSWCFMCTTYGVY
ncbi:hypothetical protein VPHK367G1_0023 [Vibrio phage K367 g1]